LPEAQLDLGAIEQGVLQNVQDGLRVHEPAHGSLGGIVELAPAPPGADPRQGQEAEDRYGQGDPEHGRSDVAARAEGVPDLLDEIAVQRGFGLLGGPDGLGPDEVRHGGSFGMEISWLFR
jgi:hypothetical protein